MSDENKEQPKKDANPDDEQYIPKEITLKYDSEPFANLTRAINERKNAEKEGNDSPDSVGNRQINAQQKGNRIAMIAIYVNGVLAALTIVALILSAKAVHEASRAGDLADSAFRQYKRANDVAEQNYKLAKEAFESNSQSGQQSLELSKRGLQNQTKSLDEAEKNFQITNRPYLEYTNFSITTLEDNKNVVITYNLLNLGNQPLKVLYGKMYWYYSFRLPENPFDSLVKTDTAIYNSYVSKESPNQARFESYKPVAPNGKSLIEHDILRMYLWGNSTYKNLVTNKLAHYLFVVRLKYPVDKGWTLIYNENFYGDVPKKIRVNHQP